MITFTSCFHSLSLCLKSDLRYEYKVCISTNEIKKIHQNCQNKFDFCLEVENHLRMYETHFSCFL